jgi:hypothetical protein
VDITVMQRTVGGDPGTELASDYGCPPTSPPVAPAGSCVAPLRPLLDGLVTGIAGTELRDLVERELWRQLPAVPLFQQVDLVVSTPEADVATDVGTGPFTTGPLTGAQRWTEPSD